MSLSRGRKRNDGSRSTIQLSSSARATAGSAAGTSTLTYGDGDTSAHANTEEDEGESPRRSVAAAQSKSRIQYVGCRKMCAERVPRGKAVMLVLTLVTVERYVFTGAADNALRLIPAFADKDDPTAATLGEFVGLLLLHSVGRVFYPVGGFIADVYWGRYRVIHVGLWLYWLAFCLLVIGSIVQAVTNHATIFCGYIVPIVAFPSIVIASGGFQSTVIPFGADQLEAANSNELSSYFYWFYFVVQLGSIVSVVADGIMSSLLPHVSETIQPLISLTLISLALVLHNVLQNWYFRNIVWENCVKLVKDVLCYVATVKRRLPQYRRAFRYSEGRVPRIELAKHRYDGIFTEDQVEDVKTFCRICLVLFSFCGLFFAMPAVRH